MARIARIIWPGCPYHVTHRGNRGGPVFLDDRDRYRYLELLREDAERAGLRIWTYALMTNHVHLIVVGEHVESMARALGSAHGRHARSIHGRNGWTGHLWANRYHSTPMDEVHLWAAARYVESNPVRAGMVQRAEDYPWSSARAHAFGVTDPLLDPDRPFPGAVGDWIGWLAKGGVDPRVDTIRRNTPTGRPSGAEEFVRDLEKALGRSVRRRRAGRQPALPEN